MVIDEVRLCFMRRIMLQDSRGGQHPMSMNGDVEWSRSVAMQGGCEPSGTQE